MSALKRVALGMSGGVDSSTSAIVLAQAGYEVVGVTCRFLEGQSAADAVSDARAVCKHLGIPHHEIDCRSLFDSAVINPFVSAYAQGLTPNPCVICNAYAKFPALIRAADDLECPFIATGHYARIVHHPDSGRYSVAASQDNSKDQSYMLALLDQTILARLILPLGELTKSQTRIQAAEAGLPVANKPESQDICFAHSGYRQLLDEHGVCKTPGAIVDCEGHILGKHSGLSDYTIGQRKGIGIASSDPYYVIAKRFDTNELVIGTEQQARIGSVIVSAITWQAIETLEVITQALVKLRYRSRCVACTLHPMIDGRVFVELAEPQATTAPGQYAVFSQGDIVYGGGIIEEVRPA